MNTPRDGSGLLSQILSTPTAPFCEHRVRELVQRELERSRIAHFTDEFGNLWIGAQNRREGLRLALKRTRDPLALVIAHIDHPGFHVGRRLGPRRYSVRWLGGGPIAGLENARRT